MISSCLHLYLICSHLHLYVICSFSLPSAVCVDSHQAYGASHTAMAGSVSILHSLFASRCIPGGAWVPSFLSAHHNVPL
jgi:hypothetical protein